ncbi:hypothetical protein GGH13_004171 [Coemansia sp. S155-1]|nr:hypothetical protein GGH13_004171 [Coemansia sp. S155-1]
MRVENRTGMLSGVADTEVEDAESEVNERVDRGADEVVELELVLMLVLVDPLLDVVSESFAVSDLLSDVNDDDNDDDDDDVDVDVDVAESLVDEVAACESLELEGAMTVMVTTPETELSVARSEPINSAIDVLIGYSIDNVPICCSDIGERLLNVKVEVTESVGDGDVAEVGLVELLLSDDDNDVDAVLVVRLDSVERGVEVVGEEVVDASVDVIVDDGELFVKLEVCVLDVKDDDGVVELLELDVVKPPNQALKLGVADKELDKLTVVDGDVTRESVVDGAKSKLLEWSSDNDAVVNVELLLVVEAGENSQSAEVDESSVLEVLVLRVLEIGVLD